MLSLAGASLSDFSRLFGIYADRSIITHVTRACVFDNEFPSWRVVSMPQKDTV